MAGPMTDADKGKRIAELTAKMQAGKATAEEIKELNALMMGAAADQKAGKPMAAQAPTQAQFDAERAKAAAAEQERQRQAALAADTARAMAGAPVISTPVPVVKPEDMKVNPDLLPALGLAATPTGDIQRIASDGQTGRENPRWYPPMATASGVASAPKSEKTPVQKLIDSLKEETKANGPNFADFIEAASAGWQGKKAAYLEKQADLAARAADIGKLEKTAQLEEALNQERIKADVIKALVASGQLPMSSLEALGITGIQGIGGVSKGAAVGNMFAQRLGGD